MAGKAKRITTTRVILGIIALVCLTALWVFWRWHSSPGFWRENQKMVREEAGELSGMADEIEAKLIGEVSDADPSAETTIRVPYKLANAWLRVNLPQWAQHQGWTIPPPLSDFMIAQRGGKPVVAFSLKTPEIDQVISMRFDVRMTGSGQATVKLDDFRAGQLSIPAESVIEHLGRKMPAYDITPLKKVIYGQSFDPVLPHPGYQGKNLRVVGFEAEDDALVVRVRGESR